MAPLFQDFCTIAVSLTCFFSLILNESVEALSALKSTIVLLAASIAGSSLQYCHKVRDFLNIYQYILLNYELTLVHQYHEHHLLAYCLFCLRSY